MVSEDAFEPGKFVLLAGVADGWGQQVGGDLVQAGDLFADDVDVEEQGMEVVAEYQWRAGRVDPLPLSLV